MALTDTCIAICGDSQFGSFAHALTPLLASINPDVTEKRGGIVTGRAGTATGTAGVVNAVTGPGHLQNYNYAVNGTGVDDIAGDGGAKPSIVSNIMAHSPTSILVNTGTNNLNQYPGTLATFRTWYLSMIDQMVAISPTVRIICFGTFTPFGETWTTSGGLKFSTVTSVGMAVMASEIAACVALRPGNAIFVDAITPALAQEQILNAPEPGTANGILSSDGVHANATGSALLSSLALPYFS